VIRIAVVLVLAGAAACESQSSAPQTTAVATTAAPMTAAPATAAPPPPEPTSAEVPVPEDFETEASNSVHEDNYRAELDRIAGEIEQASR
jgi:hypothetical protein